MFKEIVEVRYTNQEQDTLYVLFEDDDGVNQEMYIPAEGPERDAIAELGISEENIIDQTADWKRSAMADISNIAIESARNLYQPEIDRKKTELVKAEALFRQQDSKYRAEIVKYESKLLTQQAALIKLEEETPARIKAINSFANASISTENVEAAMDKIIPFLKDINENKDAIDYLKTKTDSKATNVIGLLKALM